MHADSTETPRVEIPGYRIEREIGVGGMATVYLAVQENLHREVALKVMTPGLAVDETYCKRFLKEGRIAAQLNHTNLLTVYDIGVHDNHYYMASEYLPGGTVRDRMNAGMSPEEVVHIVTDIAQGLQYAHSKGFVHRDVKPGNMLFRANGDCVLADFGIAKAVDSNTGATKLGTSIGTPHYMSPEQAKGEKDDHRTDLYSLGVVFYEMLTGRPPFDADDPFSVALMQINDPVPPLPPEFERYQRVIERLMTKDRDARYRTADEFLDDLETDTGSRREGKPVRRRVEAKPVSPAPPRAPAQPRRVTARRRSALPLAIGGTAAIVLILVLVLGWRMFERDDGTDAPPPRPGPDGQTVAPPADRPARAERIAALMTAAAEAVAAGRLLSPGGDNALERYRAVLAEDPNHDAARLALRELANQVETTAQAAWAAGDLERAHALLVRARAEFPDDQGIVYLLTRLEQQFVDQGLEIPGAADPGTDSPTADRGQIAELLRQADQFYDANVYSHPPGRNAMDLYLKVLELDPENARANERLERIADLWASAAISNLERGNLEMARKMIDRGLQARPDHARLRELSQRAAGG